MTARSRVRRKPLPPTPTIDRGTGLPYVQLSTESFDDMCHRLGIVWPDPVDYQPQVFASPADMFSALTGYRPGQWQDFIAYTEWQDQQQAIAPETTQAITATVVEPTVADRYTALAPENIIVVTGEVVDP